MLRDESIQSKDPSPVSNTIDADSKQACPCSTKNLNVTRGGCAAPRPSTMQLDFERLGNEIGDGKEEERTGDVPSYDSQVEDTGQ